MSIIKILNSESFFNEVLNSNVPVITVFGATWCGPCKIFKETLNEVAEDIQTNNQTSKIKFVTIDVDEVPDVTSNYNIRTVPTTLIIVNKNIKEEIKGAINKPTLLNYINKYTN